MSKKKAIKDQITKPSDNLIDAATISNSENLEMTANENPLPVGRTDVSKPPENTEVICEIVVIEPITANSDDIVTIVESVAENNEQANEPVVEVPVVISNHTENRDVLVEGTEPVIDNILQVEEVEPLEPSKKKSDATANNIDKRVKLVGTSYHYFRKCLKSVLRSYEIQSAKFIKDATGWNGHITILENDKEKALKVLAQYQIDNTVTKILWWDVIAN